MIRVGDESERKLLIELLSQNSDLRAVKIVQRLQREQQYNECRSKALDEIYGRMVEEKGGPEPELRLSNTDIKVVLQWLKQNAAFDDETLSHSDDNRFFGRKNIFWELLSYCGHYIHSMHYKELLSSLFYNDEVDEWYFEQGADPAKVANDYFFPCEEFLFSFFGQVVAYCELSGQGTVCALTKVESLENYGKRFGLTLEETKAKVITILN